MTETASDDAEHYVQRLDLRDDPFAVDFESDYFYTGAMRRQLLDQLVHFSCFGGQTVLLLGATGCGTSTLLDQACELIEEVMDCCFINAEESVSSGQLLESLNEQLNFQLPSPVSQTDFFVALQSGLIIDGEPEPIMLAVDQAHYLSIEGYNLLQELVDLGGGNICLLIAGEYELEQRLTSASFNQKHIKLIELEPLTEAQTGDYILGLLRSVGYTGNLPLSNDQLAVLHERCAGNLVEINQLVPSLLDVKGSASLSRLRFGIPVAHVAAVSILAAALIGLWLYHGSDEKPADVVIAAEPAGSEKLEAATIMLAKTEKVAPRPKVQAVVASAESLKQPDIAEAAIESKPAPVASMAVAERIPAAPVKKAEPTPPVVTARPSMPVREQRLLAYPETNYLLQLIGLVEEARAREIVKRYVNRMPVTYFETRLKGKPWFVVVTGPYSDKAAALAGVKVLPAELQRQRPWARSVAGVQKDIRSNRQ